MDDSPLNLQRERQAVGNPRFDSGRYRPAPSIIRTPKAPALLFPGKNEMQLAKVDSDKIVSGLRNRIRSPRALDNAKLFAFANPRFCPHSRKRTVGSRVCKYSIVPSEDALSATMISVVHPVFSNCCAAFNTENRHCSRKYLTS